MTIIKSICEIVLENEAMSNHTSFKIGGPADFLVMPQSPKELIDLWNACKNSDLPITILGDGANVLVSDEGIRGVVVFTNKMCGYELLEGERIRAQAGMKLTALAQAACGAGLAGLPFASGIPGTVGGAIYMNAGAYHHEIEEFIESVTVFFDDEIIVKSRSEMDFGYRKSFAQRGDILILDAIFQLESGDSEKIREEMQELNARRKKSQPLEYHSAGSFFKRPEGNFAGRLIEDSGLKGLAVGDAQVSEKHAGFVVNKGNATAADVLALMRQVQATVYEKYGVKLEPEVQILGV
jgi:UDP-N-acetylmuramate dehydrogenase